MKPTRSSVTSGNIPRNTWRWLITTAVRTPNPSSPQDIEVYNYNTGHVKLPLCSVLTMQRCDYKLQLLTPLEVFSIQLEKKNVWKVMEPRDSNQYSDCPDG
jgi:hypothetical protein